MSKKHILIVEDESSMAKQLKWGLADAYDISVAATAPDALGLIRENPPLSSCWTWASPLTRTGQRKGSISSNRSFICLIILK